MTTWTNRELDRIEHTDELEIAPVRGNGAPRTPTTIWVVREGDDLYVRAYRGHDSAWWRTARTSREGHISSGGISKDVTFDEVGDSAVNDRIDAAYRTKYSRHSDTYVPPMVAETARATTLKLVPQ